MSAQANAPTGASFCDPFLGLPATRILLDPGEPVPEEIRERIIVIEEALEETFESLVDHDGLAMEIDDVRRMLASTESYLDYSGTPLDPDDLADTSARLDRAAGRSIANERHPRVLFESIEEIFSAAGRREQLLGPNPDWGFDASEWPIILIRTDPMSIGQVGGRFPRILRQLTVVGDGSFTLLRAPEWFPRFSADLREIGPDVSIYRNLAGASDELLTAAFMLWEPSMLLAPLSKFSECVSAARLLGFD